MRLRPPLLALATLFLGGCVSVLPEPEAVAIYRLPSAPPGPKRAITRDLAVVLAPPPIASPALSGDRIALEDAAGRLGYITGARWDAPAPRVVQEAVLAAFEASAAGPVAVKPQDGAQADYDLRSDLLAFEAKATSETGPLEVRVILRARLVDVRRRQLVAARRFDQRAPAKSRDITALRGAFSEATNAAARAIADWSEQVTAAEAR
ncbi:MAG: ABC-type transport auxiliary lipoprotein family protein [Maricaulaceae bacterium]